MKDKTFAFNCNTENINVMTKLFQLADGDSIYDLESNNLNNLDQGKLNLVLEVYPLEFLKLGSFNTLKRLRSCISDILKTKNIFGNKLPDSFYQKELYLVL
jgi:hypothetical protein